MAHVTETDEKPGTATRSDKIGNTMPPSPAKQALTMTGSATVRCESLVGVQGAVDDDSGGGETHRWRERRVAKTIGRARG